LGLGCRTLIGDGEQNQPSSPSDRGHGSSLTVFRLLRGLKQDGAASLLSKRRGRPSEQNLLAAKRQQCNHA
jgi:hypothetical protein